MKKILVVGGGTGGHLFPALAIKQGLEAKNCQVNFITDSRCQKYLDKDVINVHIINSSSLKNGLWGKLLSVLIIIKAIIQSICLLAKLKPEIVVAFGGYPSLPPLFAAKLLGIKIMLHEQNCFLGKVNKLFAPYATSLALTFAETKNLPQNMRTKIIVTGNPVRAEISAYNNAKDFTEEPFKILVIGGSQGAKVFDELVPEALRLVMVANPGYRIEVVQQTSKGGVIEIEKKYKKLKIGISAAEFFYKIGMTIASSHLVIARAGASTIAELIATNSPAILIPYPFAAERHQHYNAEFIASNKGGWCFDQKDLTALALSKQISALIADRQQLATASKNLTRLQQDSQTILVDHILA